MAKTSSEQIKYMGEEKYNKYALIHSLEVARLIEKIDYVGDVSTETEWATERIEKYGCFTVAR